MFPKILIPLNGLRDSEEVFRNIRSEISSGSEVILLQIMPPGDETESDSSFLSGGMQEKISRHEAIDYLHGVAGRYGEGSENWSCEVISYVSVAEAIVDFAIIARVDLIAMYSCGEDSISDYIVGNIDLGAVGSNRIAVKVFGPREVIVSA